MNLFNYLMNKNDKEIVDNNHLLEYLLNASKLTTITGTELNIIAKKRKINKLILTKESTQETTSIVGGDEYDSPTPEHPQEINTVKGYRNLFDGNLEQGSFNEGSGSLIEATNRVRSVNYINVENKTYTFNLKDNSNYYIVVYVYDLNDVYKGGESTVLWSNLPFTRSFESDRKIKIGIRYKNNTDMTTSDVDEISIIEGNTTKPYVPYGNNYVYTKVSNGTDTNYYTIPLNGNEIAGIGNYKDELIVDKNGKCWLNKKIGKVVLDENSTGITIANAKTNSTYFNYSAGIFKHTSVGNLPIGLCNYLEKKLANTIYGGDTQGFTFTSTTGDLRFNLLNTIASTINALSTWLSTHNLIIYGVLETPEPIDLNYTVDIRLFNGVNNITNSDDMTMTLKYYS